MKTFNQFVEAMDNPHGFQNLQNPTQNRPNLNNLRTLTSFLNATQEVQKFVKELSTIQSPESNALLQKITQASTILNSCLGDMQKMGLNSNKNAYGNFAA
jgi:hypothetical protein